MRTLLRGNRASAYDDFGRKLKETDGLNRTWVMTYDVTNNPLTVTDPKAQQTTLTWGYGHQLLTRAAGTQTTQWTRNDLGQVTQVFHPTAQTLLYSYTYDVAHRPASFTDARGNKTLSYNYSAGGLLNFFQETEGKRTDYVYDYSGRLAEVWAPNGDIVAFAYDAGGRLTDKWLPNGVKTKYAYNGDNTLASVTNLHSANTISIHVYAYDGFRNRTRHDETIGVGATTTPYLYQYDNLNRLTAVKNNTTSAVIESYAFDVVGNRTSKTDSANNTIAYVYDAANQLTEAHQTTSGALLMAFNYDANGNLTRKCEGTGVTTGTTCGGSITTDLTYDALNRLTQAAKTGITTQTYGYDDQGRRIQKAIGTSITNYLYNGDNAHATYGSVWDTPTAKYTYGPGIDTPILKTSGTATQYFHQDGLGSVVALTNQSGGTDATTRYDAWGNVLGSTGTQSIYGYTGREPDETGLIYYRARYYDAAIGRFTQRDPVGIAGGLNAYAFVAGNPTNLTDPLGLQPQNAVAVMFAQNQTTYADGGDQVACDTCGLVAAAGRGSRMSSGSQRLDVRPEPFTDSIVGQDGRVFTAEEANLLAAMIYGEKTHRSVGSSFARDFVGIGRDVVTVITEESLTEESFAIASAPLVRLQQRWANTLDKVLLTPGAFEGLNNNFAKEVMNNQPLSDPAGYALARVTAEAVLL